METWQAVIENLKSLLTEREDLKKALEISIQKAGFDDIQTADQYYHFLNGLLMEIPVQRTMSGKAIRFHYLISQSPGDILKKDQAFRKWLVSFSRDKGAFLDTTASAKNLDGFINDPSYQINDYDPGPSGWLTFNQFFARRIKPGKRPVHDRCNNAVVVAATDSVYLGCWPIDGQSALTAKGVTYFISQLLEDSPYRDAFSGGLFTHSYLDTNDYHRYHLPVGGVIKEVRRIPGDVLVQAIKKEDGTLTTTDEIGFQFTQTRGLVVMESALGLVAVLPIGMGHVSSVNLTVEPGLELAKGEEFGYFCYGGSDMVILFQAGKVAFTAKPGTHYKQGEMIARAQQADGQ